MAVTQYQREVSARAYARKKAIEKGEPIPEWAQKRSLKRYSTPEEKAIQDNIRHQRYRDKNRNTINARTQRRRENLQARILPYKQQPCMDCGQQFPPICMDFDHRDPDDKVDPVATMIANCQSIETILAEIAKCDTVCSNCHRIRTFITRKGIDG